jgi:hypothetical protein
LIFCDRLTPFGVSIQRSNRSGLHGWVSPLIMLLCCRSPYIRLASLTMSPAAQSPIISLNPWLI